MMTKRFNYTALAAAAMLAGFTLHAHAALIAHEDFDYAGGSDLTTIAINGGSGWTAAWADTGVNGLKTSGTGQSLHFDQSPAAVTDGSTHVFSSENLGNERDWNTAVDLGTQNFYFTALIRVFSGANAVDMRAEFYDGAGATGNMRGNVGISNGDLFTHVTATGYAPAGGGVASGVVAEDTTYLLAMKRTTAGIFASLIEADGNPATLASEPVWQVTDAGASGVDLTSIRLIVNGTGGGIRLDELTLATDWDNAVASVIPVPAPAALPAGLAMLGVIAARRRR